MLVSPLPGSNRANLLSSLQHLHSKVLNLRTPLGHTDLWLHRYLEWVNEAASMLRGQLRPADIDSLVLTRRYELLLSTGGRLGPGVDHPPTNGLLAMELDERTTAFAELSKSLHGEIQRWEMHAEFMALDTSVYLTHPSKLEILDFAELLGRHPSVDLHVLVPILVVEELDGRKLQGNTWYRASHSLAHLDKVLQAPTGRGVLRAPSGERSGKVTVELLFDPPGHVRLPVNDDEIIDRLRFVQWFMPRPITLITYDTNQSFKARAVDLRAKRLRRPEEDEPEPEPKAKRRRQARPQDEPRADSDASP